MISAALDSSLLEWKELHLKRGELLSRAGEVERYIYYIKEGAIRAYSFVEENEFTIRFGYKGSIFTSLSSYFTGKKGEMYLEAMRSSVVLQCSKKNFEEYIHSDQSILLEYNQLLEQLIVGLIEREEDLMLQDPRSRLERIQKRSPQLFQEVPHKYIAAYLRMSPETLSRLMNPKS